MRLDFIIKLAEGSKPDVVAEALARPENRSLCAEAVAKFEELGDQETASGALLKASQYYSAATTAALILLTIPASGEDLLLMKKPLIRLTQKAQDAKRHFDEQAAASVAKPLPKPPAAEPAKLDRKQSTFPWDQALEAVETLVRDGSVREADRALSKLWSSHDDTDSGYRCVTWLEDTGDRLAPKHPEQARWFYEKLREYAACLPAETAFEGHDRAARVDTAAYKLAQVKARLPKARATIQLSLAGWASPAGNSAESQVTSQTVAEDGVLDLAPDWAIEHYRQAGGEVLRPEQFPARYRFRVTVDAKQASLAQVQDQYGRSQPFQLDGKMAAADGRSAPPFQLTPAKAATIGCSVPGGGPAWTLTLTRIE